MIRRALAASLVWLLAWQPAWAACPTIDGFTPIQQNGISGSGTITTTQTNDVALIYFYSLFFTFGSCPDMAVATLSGGSLTWAKRKSQTYSFVIGATFCVQQELWWASAPSPLAAVAYNYTLNSASVGTAMMAFGVNGAGTPTNPWDTNGSLPKLNADNSGATNIPHVSGIDTNSGGIFLAICSGVIPGPGGQCATSPPSGYTFIGNVGNTGGQGDNSVFSNTSAVSVGAYSTNITGSTASYWQAMFDVIDGAAPDCGPSAPTPNRPRRPFAHGWPW